MYNWWKVSTSGVADKPCATAEAQIFDFRRFFLSPSQTPSYPPIMSLFGSGSGAAPKSSADIKNAVVLQLQQETAMTNARALITVRHRVPCL